METRKLEKLDVTKYVGTDAKINKAEFQELKYGKCIFIETTPIPLIDGDTLPENAELKASIILPLQEDEKDDTVFIGEDTKAEKFIKAKGLKVEDVPDFELGASLEMFLGIEVKCQKNDRGFLEIA